MTDSGNDESSGEVPALAFYLILKNDIRMHKIQFPNILLNLNAICRTTAVKTKLYPA
jgi:hypothetical protein